MLKNKKDLITLLFIVSLTLATISTATATPRDLKQIKAEGTLRHLGIPYANFVTGSGDGLDVELIQLFAKHLGVKYKYIQTSWSDAITDLNGCTDKENSTHDKTTLSTKGDLIANGFTILPQRKNFVKFSEPTFPTQVWLIAKSTSKLKPISPTGKIKNDIKLTKELLNGRSLIGKEKTCLDPLLYDIDENKVKVTHFKGNLNDMAPAVIDKKADFCLLDVPDSLVALELWPGKIKVMGPISLIQNMAVAFRKTSPELSSSFNDFFLKIKKDGTYKKLVKKYYPSVFFYFPTFFN